MSFSTNGWDYIYLIKLSALNKKIDNNLKENKILKVTIFDSKINNDLTKVILKSFKILPESKYPYLHINISIDCMFNTFDLEDISINLKIDLNWLNSTKYSNTVNSLEDITATVNSFSILPEDIGFTTYRSDFKKTIEEYINEKNGNTKSIIATRNYVKYYNLFSKVNTFKDTYDWMKVKNEVFSIDKSAYREDKETHIFSISCMLEKSIENNSLSYVDINGIPKEASSALVIERSVFGEKMVMPALTILKKDKEIPYEKKSAYIFTNKEDIKLKSEDYRAGLTFGVIPFIDVFKFWNQSASIDKNSLNIRINEDNIIFSIKDAFYSYSLENYPNGNQDYRITFKESNKLEPIISVERLEVNNFYTTLMLDAYSIGIQGILNKTFENRASTRQPLSSSLYLSKDQAQNYLDDYKKNFIEVIKNKTFYTLVNGRRGRVSKVVKVNLKPEDVNKVNDSVNEIQLTNLNNSSTQLNIQEDTEKKIKEVIENNENISSLVKTVLKTRLAFDLVLGKMYNIGHADFYRKMLIQNEFLSKFQEEQFETVFDLYNNISGKKNKIRIDHQTINEQVIYKNLILYIYSIQNLVVNKNVITDKGDKQQTGSQLTMHFFVNINLTFNKNKKENETYLLSKFSKLKVFVKVNKKENGYNTTISINNHVILKKNDFNDQIIKDLFNDNFDDKKINEDNKKIPIVKQLSYLLVKLAFNEIINFNYNSSRFVNVIQKLNLSYPLIHQAFSNILEQRMNSFIGEDNDVTTKSLLKDKLTKITLPNNNSEIHKIKLDNSFVISYKEKPKK